MIRGYAVTVSGVLDLDTVGSTVRAAKVNGILRMAKIMPMASWNDEYIRKVWNQVAPMYNMDVVKVNLDIVI